MAEGDARENYLNIFRSLLTAPSTSTRPALCECVSVDYAVCRKAYGCKYIHGHIHKDLTIAAASQSSLYGELTICGRSGSSLGYVGSLRPAIIIYVQAAPIKLIKNASVSTARGKSSGDFFFFLRNTVQHRRSQHAHTFIPMNAHTHTLPL